MIYININKKRNNNYLTQYENTWIEKKKNSVNTSYFFLRKKIDLHRSVIFHIVVDKHTKMKGKLR